MWRLFLRGNDRRIRMRRPMTPDPSPAPALSLPFRVASLSPRKPTRFDIVASPDQRAALAQELGLSKVDSLTFKGEIRPSGKRDFMVVADLQARIVQPCSISLVPVKTVISEQVQRTFLADFVVPDGIELEMQDGDDAIEPLPEVIDAGFVATEALALAVPLYPRAPGAELGDMAVTEPGVAPLRDGDLKPFAGLAALKAKLGGQNGGEDGTT
jgi:uncharacterized metal-binding protein YceD (DUF177 family)